VRQLAAALQRGLMQIIANNWAIHKGESKLAHSKGFASDKKHASLGETAAIQGPPSAKTMLHRAETTCSHNSQYYVYSVIR
jgi:hypothetical protein